MSAATVATRFVLHLNLNTTDIEAASRFYIDVFGLDLRMKSSGDDGDWRFHGIEEPVSSAGWFLYDDRGPRVSPALELVQWYRPATADAAYPSLVHRGLTSVGLRVPTLDGLADAVTATGGHVVGDLPGGLLLRDPDGVHVEVSVDPLLPATRIASARVGCADLTASLEWYAVLGFRPTDEIRTQAFELEGRPVSLRTVRVALETAAVELELTQWLDPVADEAPRDRLWYRGMVRMAVSVDDLDDAISLLEANGGPVPEPLFFVLAGTPIGGLRVLFLQDPDGFTVELVHRPPRHFTPAAGGAPS
ncbi:MAG: lactoylglutathione lyase [Frankiales bacterium]|nr:lactoylglutathione lyase [Frankiales bacterium]